MPNWLRNLSTLSRVIDIDGELNRSVGEYRRRWTKAAAMAGRQRLLALPEVEVIMEEMEMEVEEAAMEARIATTMGAARA